MHVIILLWACWWCSIILSLSNYGMPNYISDCCYNKLFSLVNNLVLKGRLKCLTPTVVWYSASFFPRGLLICWVASSVSVATFQLIKKENNHGRTFGWVRKGNEKKARQCPTKLLLLFQTSNDLLFSSLTFWCSLSLFVVVGWSLTRLLRFMWSFATSVSKQWKFSANITSVHLFRIQKACWLKAFLFTLSKS